MSTDLNKARKTVKDFIDAHHDLEAHDRPPMKGEPRENAVRLPWRRNCAACALLKELGG